MFCNLIAICVEPERLAVASPTNLSLSPPDACVRLVWAADYQNRPLGVIQVFLCPGNATTLDWKACTCTWYSSKQFHCLQHDRKPRVRCGFLGVFLRL